jgi:hypothetical protein
LEVTPKLKKKKQSLQEMVCRPRGPSVRRASLEWAIAWSQAQDEKLREQRTQPEQKFFFFQIVFFFFW